MGKVLQWVPAMVLAAGLIGSTAVDSYRLSAHAGEIQDLFDGMDENEEAIEQIPRLLIRRQGEVELQVQRIETEQQQQGEDLEEILRLLQSLQR